MDEMDMGRVVWCGVVWCGVGALGDLGGDE